MIYCCLCCFSIHHFKDDIFFPSTLHCFIQEVFCHSYICYSVCYVSVFPLAAFKIFYLTFVSSSLNMICLDVLFLVFILLGVLWGSQIYSLRSVISLGMFSAIISSNIPSLLFFFTFLSVILITHMLDHLILFNTCHDVLFCSPFLSAFLFQFDQFYWQIFKFVDSFLLCVQSTDETVKGTAHFCF